MELQELIVILRLFVTLAQELGVRLQPFAVLLLKRLVFLAAEQRIFVLLVQCFEENSLGVINTLVVGYLLLVELFLLRLVFLLLRRRQAAHLLYIYIYRV